MASDAGTAFTNSPIHASKHARERWAQRTDGDIDIIDGWAEAKILIAGYNGTWTGDEYRVHEREAVVIARRDTTLVTVLDLEGEDAEQWLRHAVHEEYGEVWTDSVGYAGGDAI